MLIFKSERDAGLAEQITKARLVSYASVVEKASFTNEQIGAAIKALANKFEEMCEGGLYPTQSILVSTIWNLNDDVFDKYETWLARKTPEDKPTNDGHDEKKIVGHITGNWAIDEAGNLIPDDIAADDLPDKFHIFNTAVIYNAFSDPEMAAQAKALIADIEAGKKFVSMEAYFRGFDYAIKSSAGEMQIVQRNENTAFLTKHLRVYGGTGEYDGYRVGRVLRGITFSGKGYVDRPANPESIIFDKNSSFDFVSAEFVKELKSVSGVYVSEKINTGEDDKMSDELNNKIAELTTANTTLATDLASVKTENADLLKKISDLTVANETYKTQNEAITAANESLKTEVESVRASNVELSSELALVKKNEKIAARKAKLVGGGYTEEEATAHVTTFDNLSDEQFETLASTLIAAKKVPTQTEATVEPVVKPEPKVVEPVVEPTGTALNLSVGTENNTMASLREQLAVAFEKISSKPTKRKKVNTKENQ